MALKIAREGVGWGAQKQFRLLRNHWGDFDAVKPPITLYWNAFTRDLPRLERRKKGGVTIVSRVGGWHFDTAEITSKVLEMSDGAIFVSDYTRRLAEKYFGDKVPKRWTVIVNSAETRKPKALADPPYLLVRAGGLGYPVWKRHMLSRSLSIFAVHAVWPRLRKRYPTLGLKILGRSDRKVRALVPPGDGIEYVPYMDDPDRLHRIGGKAAALVHLVIGDHSPNTVAEMVGEGRPIVVLDKGGAKEVAGGAGMGIRAVESDTRTDLDVWWPLDEKTYTPNLDQLYAAICEALAFPDARRKFACIWAKRIEPPLVAKKYMEFMELCAK